MFIDTFEFVSSMLMMISSFLGIVCAFIFIVISLSETRCRTVTIRLVLNSIIAGLFANLICNIQSIYQLLNIGHDQLCTVRGFFLHASIGLFYHSLCVQAFHRLCVTVYSTRRIFQSTYFTLSMIIIQWIFSSLFALPVFLWNRIIYYNQSQICQVSLEDFLSCIYLASLIFLLPLLIIVIIYCRIVRYMKKTPFSGSRHTNITKSNRQMAEIRLIRRILTLVVILVLLGSPYFISFLSVQLRLLASDTHIIRVCYLFVTSGQSAAMFIHLITTDPVKENLIKHVTKFRFQSGSDENETFGNVTSTNESNS